MYLIYNDKGDIVKVLSIREPYASLIKMKIKTIETRSFKTNYRGELYIHASLSKSNVDDELSKLVTPMYGKIICKCKLVDCVLMTENYVKEIKEKNIGLEMCPTSNRQTKAVSNMNEYPLSYYLELGLCVTINTDDMAIEGTTLKNEFDYIEKQYNISYEQELQLLKNAISCAFCSDITKEKLLQTIQSDISILTCHDSIRYLQNGKVIAEIDFPTTGDDEITITHTFVDDCLRGQGYAKKLVEGVITYAKENHKYVRATCSYALHYFEKNPNSLYRG